MTDDVVIDVPGDPDASDVRHVEPWRRQLDETESGPRRTSLHNAVTVIAEHHELRGLLVYDRLAEGIRMVRPAPWGREGAWTDADASELAAWFGDPRRKLWSIPSTLAHEAAAVVAARNPYHPVRAYLEALPPWDGTDRLDHMLSDYWGTRYDDYTAAVGRNLLVGAVARVMAPGAKLDTMPVLEGPQGAGKSQSIATLFGPEWTAELHESPASKDFYQALRGRWALEISEMQAFSKAEQGKIKSAISCAVDVYRPSYARTTQAHPRQCVFVGTTNESEYLQDPTGARRFLPVAVGSDIDLEGITAGRDALWAEALARYRRGEPWWHYPAAARDIQDSRQMHDAWGEIIATWLDAHGVPEISTTRLLREVLEIEIGRHTRQEMMRVGKIMHRLGWQRRQVRSGDRRPWVYVRPPEED